MSVERHEGVAPLADEWDALADRAAVPPWLRPGWFEAWWRAFGSGRLESLGVRRDGRLVAVAPLARGRGLLRAPTNWHTPSFGLVAEDGEARRELAAALLRAGGVGLDLAFLDLETGGLPELRAAAHARGWRTLERVQQRSPYVATAGDYESYLASLDRHHVKEVARRRRRLEEQGALELELLDAFPDLERALDEGFPVEGSGWKDEQGSAIRSQPATERFYRELARWAARRGILRLGFLRLDGRPLAFEYAFEDAGAFAILKGGYDQEFRRFGPGMLITGEEIRHAFERGLASCELLGDDDDYKLAWTDSVRERVRFQAFAPSAAGRAAYALQAHGRPLARRAVAGAQSLRRRAAAARGA